MGAPLVSKERLPDPEQILRPFRTMEADRVPFSRGHDIGNRWREWATSIRGCSTRRHPGLDADPRGRAFPEMQMSSFTVGVCPCSRLPWRIFKQRSDRPQTQNASGPSGSDGCIGGRPASNLSPAENSATNPGARAAWPVSRAIRLGAAVRKQIVHADPVETILAVEAGIGLFRGKVIDVERRTPPASCAAMQ
jgi:DUF917 family protein